MVDDALAFRDSCWSAIVCMEAVDLWHLATARRLNQDAIVTCNGTFANCLDWMSYLHHITQDESSSGFNTLPEEF